MTEEMINKYGDGSGLNRWTYNDRKSSLLKVCRVANNYAIPALKALGLPITLENVIAQVNDRNFAITLDKETKINSLSRQITDWERSIFERYLKDDAEPKVNECYKGYNGILSIEGIDAEFYKKWLYVDGEDLRANLEQLTKDHTKHLETPEEHIIWENLCQTCECLNTLFAGKNINLDYVKNLININQRGEFVPNTPIDAGDFGQITTD